jgi:hypothetical protein
MSFYDKGAEGLKNYLKGSLKVLINYSISLLLFALFFITLYKYLFVYSIVIFVLMFAISYSDMGRLAIKEKRPQYGIPNYPLKGLVYGIAGFLPVILLVIIIPLIPLHVAGLDAERLKHVAVNTVLSPLYWLLKLGGESRAAYISSCFVVPVISMLGYFAGHQEFELRKFFGMNKKKVNPALKK